MIEPRRLNIFDKEKYDPFYHFMKRINTFEVSLTDVTHAAIPDSIFPFLRGTGTVEGNFFQLIFEPPIVTLHIGIEKLLGIFCFP